MAKKEKSRFNKEKEALCRAHKGPVARKLRAKKNPLVGLFSVCIRLMKCCLHNFTNWVPISSCSIS